MVKKVFASLSEAHEYLKLANFKYHSTDLSFNEFYFREHKQGQQKAVIYHEDFVVMIYREV